MKKSTLFGFSLSLLISVGTFWWGVLHGRELATSDLGKGRIAGSIKLLGNSGEKTRNIKASAEATIERNDGGNERSVDEVVAEAMALEPGEMLSPERMAKIFKLVRALDERDLQAALTLVEGQEGWQTKALVRMSILSRWAEFEGAGPADYALTHPGANPEGLSFDNQGRIDLNEIISVWSERDPEAALEWIVSRAEEFEEAGFNESRYFGTVFKALSLKNRDEAWAKLELIENDPDRIFAMSGMMNSSPDSQHRVELMERLKAIENPTARTVGYQNLISEWARQNPQEAAAFVENSSDLDSITMDALTYDVGKVWMENNAEEGADWLIRTATDENRSFRVNEVINHWLGQDPNAAAQWLSGFEPSLEIDDALISLSRRIVERDSESSFEWAARITDDTKRNQALKGSFQHWYFREPENAKAHLQASDVPPDQSAEWIEAIENRIQEVERRSGRPIER